MHELGAHDVGDVFDDAGRVRRRLGLEEILFLELPAGAQPVRERTLREALCRSVDWREQRRAWKGPKAGMASPAAAGAATVRKGAIV